jgi:hypothetical protein
MDVWAWFDELSDELYRDGDDEFADALWSLARATNDDDHEQVDALAPLLLAEARARRLPWLEVFVRHWHLQSRACKRAHGGAVLNDAVDAFERAHAPEAIGCPQSVCSVQDLCIAYGKVDGPGYAPERLAVTAETLDRIDPTWNCYRCIVSEQASAMIDAGSPEDGIRLLHEAQARLSAAGTQHLDDRFRYLRVEAFVAMGRPEDALVAVERAELDPDRSMGAGADRYRRQDRAMALAHMGRGAEALALLPSPAEVEAGDRAHWAETMAELVRLGAADNDAELGRILLAWARERLGVGTYRHAFSLASIGSALAVARGRRWAAQTAAGLAARAAAAVRYPETLRDEVDAITAAADGVPGADISKWESASALDEADGLDDPEAEVDRWLAAAARWPEDEVAALGAAASLAAAGSEDAGRWLLEWTREHPVSNAGALLLVELLAHGDPAEAEAAAEELEDRLPGEMAWLRARVAYRERRYEDCTLWCARVVDAFPDAMNARRMWADCAGRLGRWDEALEKRNAVIAAAELLEKAEQDHEWLARDHWERAVAATVVGQWDLVRASSDYLGMEVDSTSGPIDEVWHDIIVRYPDGAEVYAIRTGPVTARVRTVARSGQTQRADDLVVFDPSLAGEESPGDEDSLHIHDHLVTLSTGGCVAYEVIVVAPERPPTEARGRIEEVAARLWFLTGPDATCVRPDSELRLPVMAALVALPPGVSPKTVSSVLAELFGGTPDGARPALWPDLAEAAGDATATLHRAEWERWEF